MPPWKEDLVKDIEESCVAGSGGHCLTFVFKASQIFCEADDKGCHENRLLDNHAVSLFRHLVVGNNSQNDDGKEGGGKAAFPDARFVIISGLTNGPGIDWSQMENADKEGDDPKCGGAVADLYRAAGQETPPEVKTEHQAYCQAREKDIDRMADVLMAICGCVDTGARDGEARDGAYVVSEAKQNDCFNRSSIFFDMAQRQQHLTTSLFRKHMMQQMLGKAGGRGDGKLLDEYQRTARREALALYQTSNLDVAPIQETLETLTCINILLQTGCGIHTVYFLGHYDGTLLIQKYIEGFYYGLYQNAEKMTLKKLSWATNDDLMDMVRYLSNSLAGCGEEAHQKVLDDYNKKANKLNDAIVNNVVEKKPMEELYEENDLLPPASSKPVPRHRGDKEGDKAARLQAWKNQIPTVETAIKVDKEKRPDVCSGYTWRDHHRRSPRKEQKKSR